MKRVPAPGAKINITADGQAVNAAYLAFTTSPHEESAVRAAVQLVEAQGGDATVLTLGPAEAEEQLARGQRRRQHRRAAAPIDDADWDPQRTAAALAESIRTIEAADGPFDLVLFGNESADSGNFQIGVRVAHTLVAPMVNGIKGIEVDGSSVPRSARPTRASRCTSSRRRRCSA